MDIVSIQIESLRNLTLKHRNLAARVAINKKIKKNDIL